MLNTPFSPWPSFSEEEALAVADVMRSNRVNYWTGQECREFEKEFAKFAGTDHAIAVANGTLALDLALKGYEIGEGDEVIVTPRTFIASISCVVTAGATPVFADVDLNSGNLSAGTIAPQITDKTKAIIVVHLAGWPADMDPIMELAEAHGIKVIEDCAQAHGARYKGKPVGGLGHVGAWSFCQDKIMTTGGEGGMVTINDPDVWAKMAKGVPCFQGSCSEVYLEKAFDGTGTRPAQSLPNTRKLGDSSIMFLVHPTLTEAEITQTQNAITSVLKDAIG